MSNLPDPSSNTTNLLIAHQTLIQNQQYNTHSQNQPQILQQLPNNSNLATTDYNHQTYQSWLDTICDSNASDESKLKSIQDLSYNWESMQTLPTYTQLVEDALHKFMRILNETEPQFISELPVQQLRKKVLEIIYRTTPVVSNTSIVTSSASNLDPRTALIRDILLVIYRVIEKDNEENVIVCLKIIVDYHRHLKTTSLLVNEVNFLFFVKCT
jgi:transformation/transcription domain-associated protein